MVLHKYKNIRQKNWMPDIGNQGSLLVVGHQITVASGNRAASYWKHCIFDSDEIGYFKMRPRQFLTGYLCHFIHVFSVVLYSWLVLRLTIGLYFNFDIFFLKLLTRGRATITCARGQAHAYILMPGNASNQLKGNHDNDVLK